MALRDDIIDLYQETTSRNPTEEEIAFYEDFFAGAPVEVGGKTYMSSESAATQTAGAIDPQEEAAFRAAVGATDEGRKYYEEQQQQQQQQSQDKKEEPVASVIPASQIIDLYQTELGRDPNAEEIKYYQDYYGSRGTPGIDPFEIRQFASTPEAVTYRQGFDRAFPKLYEDIFRVGPTAQQTAEARERFGDFISPDEVNRFIRDPDTISKVQSGIRSTLGIPAVTQSGTGPIDFSKFGAAPVTTGPTATAGIERLQPRETVGGIDRLIGGTMASTFASPGFTEPDYTKFRQELPDTFKTFSDLVSENIRQDAYRRGLAAAAEVTGQQIVDPTQQAMIQELAESEGNLTPMRAGGIARLYKEGGEVGDAGLANIAQKMASYGRYGDTMLAHISPEEAMMLKAMGGSGTRNPVTGLPEFFIKKLYKGIKRIVKPIYRAVKPYIPYVLPPQIGIPLAAADAGFTDGKFDAKKAAFAAAKVFAANKVQDALAGTDSFAQFNQPVEIAGPPTQADLASGIKSVTRDPSVFESIKQFGSKVGESFDPRNISLQGMRSGAEFGIGRAADALSLKGGPGSITKAAPGAVGLTTIKGAEIAEEQMKEQKARRDAILGAQERERKKYRDLAARLGQDFPFGYNEGGISSLPARYLDGAGDGMSDSIKANIGGMQEARLADGEFVVPADVVADLGNGSSNAGAERLYSMMDRIRQARHGTTKQPPEVNVNKALPA
jgi:hypothetical protein